MNKRLRGTTLIELAAVAGIAVTVLTMAFASFARYRELSKRLVCSMNLKGIGAVALIYGENHNDLWMVPPFKSALIDVEGIDYVNDTPSINVPVSDPGEVGYDRPFQSTSETLQDPTAGSVAAATTRSFWMLVRSGDVHLPQFVCPSSEDTVDGTEDILLYYDFTGYRNISYGYQVPFGPRATQPNSLADPGRIQAADKGPFYSQRSNIDWRYDGHNLEVDSPPNEWRKYNSANHGGYSNGEGQNCLYADGHVCFHVKPIVGVDHDNIYTLMLDLWDVDKGIIYGELPQTAPTPPYPGQEAFGSGPGRFSVTDSLIYP
ncbi:MAG: hypothetical protein PVI86_16575 [Phycisphaerae bacterium]